MYRTKAKTKQFLLLPKHFFKCYSAYTSTRDSTALKGMKMWAFFYIYKLSYITCLCCISFPLLFSVLVSRHAEARQRILVLSMHRFNNIGFLITGPLDASVMAIITVTDTGTF